MYDISHDRLVLLQSCYCKRLIWSFLYWIGIGLLPKFVVFLEIIEFLFIYKRPILRFATFFLSLQNIHVSIIFNWNYLYWLDILHKQVECNSNNSVPLLTENPMFFLYKKKKSSRGNQIAFSFLFSPLFLCLGCWCFHVMPSLVSWHLWNWFIPPTILNLYKERGFQW